MAATMAVLSAPRAAASVGVATPMKMTPSTMNTMRLRGARCSRPMSFSPVDTRPTS